MTQAETILLEVTQLGKTKIVQSIQDRIGLCNQALNTTDPNLRLPDLESAAIRNEIAFLTVLIEQINNQGGR